MAKAATQSFAQMLLEVEFATGTYSKICGLVDVTVTRTANVDTTEVPDCTDESVPHYIEREVRSLDVTVSGTGVWSLASHEKMMDWFYGATPLSVKLTNSKVVADGTAGDTTIETGKALLTTLTNARTKGQKVSAEIEIQFSELPTRTAKAA
jgi:hypothetical protein